MAQKNVPVEREVAWKEVKDARDNLFNQVFSGLSEDEQAILINLLDLEAQQRAYSAPQIRKPLRELVEGRIR